MRPTDPFLVEGEVKGALSERSVRVTLRNGHGLVAYATRRSGARAAEWVPGSRVWLRVSPCDMSKGVLVESEGILK